MSACLSVCSTYTSGGTAAAAVVVQTAAAAAAVVRTYCWFLWLLHAWIGQKGECNTIAKEDGRGNYNFLTACLEET